MELVVYVDLVLMLNFVLDAAVLAMTAWVRGIPFSWKRLLASATVGAAYVGMMFVPALAPLFTLGAKLGLSLLMVWIAFGFSSLQSFVHHVAAFYGVSFAAAGGMMGVYYLLQSHGELWNGIWLMRTGGQGHVMKMGVLFLAITFAAALLLYKGVLNGRRRKEQLLQHVAEVQVAIGGQEKRCTGLIDTGNHLYDPLTRTPVMVMEASLWEDHLPPSWLARIREAEVDKLVAGIGEEEWVWQDRLRLIPYRGVNRGTSFMLALKPDYVRIEQEGRNYECRKVLVGLDGGTLASDGAYRAIIHPSLVEQSLEIGSQEV
ncbi:sigma-E processing peptidase SpoIIGA [Paenibacillus sp. SYP-B4298]|uniref:sigma-E processing peptidase SpoIIGA n=1 Tax=Paenibacillus sp. SYP-B4298 TaxID=2996034 RepID=UPI0022DD6696|nr:sigma-E processing peptidase SpoIIGA [Paenibacillus sp. SYP-B4298]